MKRSLLSTIHSPNEDFLIVTYSPIAARWWSTWSSRISLVWWRSISRILRSCWLLSSVLRVWWLIRRLLLLLRRRLLRCWRNGSSLGRWPSRRSYRHGRCTGIICWRTAERRTLRSSSRAIIRLRRRLLLIWVWSLRRILWRLIGRWRCISLLGWVTTLLWGWIVLRRRIVSIRTTIRRTAILAWRILGWRTRTRGIWTRTCIWWLRRRAIWWSRTICWKNPWLIYQQCLFWKVRCMLQIIMISATTTWYFSNQI